MSKQVIWDYFKSKGFNNYGISGLMGNIQRESGFNPKNLQSTGNKELGMTDEQYTAAVDSGKYTYDMFRSDSHGFGLAQWTFHTRKASLYNFAKKQNKSIGDLQMQLDFLYKELTGYKEVINVLKTAKSVREASDIVMLKYERPADQSESARAKRASYGETLYKEFCGAFETVSVECQVLKKNAKGKPVRALQALLNMKGFDCGVVDGSFGEKTDKAVRDFQKANGLSVDGSVGKATWTALLN